MRISVCCFLLSNVQAFPLAQRRAFAVSMPSIRTKLGSSSSDEEDTEQKLVLDNVDQQMQQLRSKYPTSETDYLAAARARNAAKMASSESRATDEDWKAAQRQAQQRGVEDDWERAAAEAGIEESKILIPCEANDGDGAEDDEPKLMLF